MKLSTLSILVTFVALHTAGYGSDGKQSSKAEAHAESRSSGNRSSQSSKTVTITSDGKNTVKRIVTTVNGVEKVVTEVTDENGRTTTATVVDPDREDEVQDGDAAAWTGIRTEELSEVLRGQLDLPENEGVAVDLVAPGSPGEKAGIVAGDLLLAFAGEPVATPDELSRKIAKFDVGETVGVTLMRKGKRMETELTLARRPEHAADEDRFLEHKEGGQVGDAGKVFGTLLENSSLPEDFKKSVKEMQKMLADFEKEHGGK